MNLNLKLIGKRIKEVRNARKIPQILLAEKSDISNTYLSYIECGKKKPSLNVIVRIAKELDTSVDSLLEGNQNTNSGTYELELDKLMCDCTPYEKRVIYEMLHALKDSIRQNKPLITNEIKDSIKIF